MLMQKFKSGAKLRFFYCEITVNAKSTVNGHLNDYKCSQIGADECDVFL